MSRLIGMEGLIIKKVISTGDQIVFYCAPHSDTPIKQWQVFYVTTADNKASPLAKLSHSFYLLEKHNQQGDDDAPTNTI